MHLDVSKYPCYQYNIMLLGHDMIWNIYSYSVHMVLDQTYVNKKTILMTLLGFPYDRDDPQLSGVI